MDLPNGTLVAIADGEQLLLFRNDGDEQHINLANVKSPKISLDNKSAGAKDQDGGPGGYDARQLDEFAHAAGVAEWLNGEVLKNKIDKLVVVADPRSLGEMRRHFHKETEAALIGELAKTLTNSPVPDIEKALKAG